MASNRSAILTKTHRVLKKHYTPTSPNMRLPVLEQMVYAACLENAKAEPAEKAYAALRDQFFDWNEVRVSTVTELAEAMPMLPTGPEAAARVKGVLQCVFEANYTFEVDSFKKENIGSVVKKLRRYKGISEFCIAHLTQTSLGGHAIPVGRGAHECLFIVGAIDEKEHAAGVAPGLERAIPKSKGVEFASLLNQLGCDFDRSPFSTSVKDILLSISASAKSRLPKRGDKKKAEKERLAKEKEELKKAAAAKKAKAAADKKTKAAAAKKTKAAAKPARPVKTKKKTTKKAKAPAKKKVKVKLKKKKRTTKTTKITTKKKKAAKKKTVKKKKTTRGRISKRKPR